jgi:hypothetical protein
MSRSRIRAAGEAVSSGPVSSEADGGSSDVLMCAKFFDGSSGQQVLRLRSTSFRSAQDDKLIKLRRRRDSFASPRLLIAALAQDDNLKCGLLRKFAIRIIANRFLADRTLADRFFSYPLLSCPQWLWP